MEELALGFNDTKELYRCYMPFFKNGGLFVRSARHYRMGQSLALSVTLPDMPEPMVVTGKVAWISPLGAQSANPVGIGIAIIDDKHGLHRHIETLLGAQLHSNEPTYTL